MINFGQLSRRFIPPNAQQPNRNRFGNMFNQPMIMDETGNNVYNPGYNMQQPEQEQPLPMQQELPPQIRPRQFQPQPMEQPQMPPQAAVPQTPISRQPMMPQQQEQPLPMQPFPTSPPQAPPEFDFASAYEKINKRPQRLAYQEAVNRGPEQIKRSKWMRLLAAAGAGGAALGGTDPAEAARAGTEAYNAPQARENARYKERVAGLGNLANMEDSDMQDRLRLLEIQRGEFWKGKGDVRETEKMAIEKRDAAIREADLSNRNRFTNAQIDQIKEEINKSQTRTWVDKTRGIQYEQKPTGEIVSHKIDSSTQERVREAGDTAGSVAEAEEKYKKAHDMRLIQGDIDVAGLQTESRENIADTNRQKAIDLAVTKGKLAAEKEPDKARKGVIINATESVARGQLPPDALDYIKVNPENGGIYSEGPNATTEQLVKDLISKSLQNSGFGDTTSGSGTTKGGTRFTVTPKGGGGGF